MSDDLTTYNKAFEILAEKLEKKETAVGIHF